MRITDKQIEHAIKQTAGNVSQAAKALQVSRTTVHKRIAKSEKLREVLRDTREELIDIAESALRREVLDGNITAIIFTLKTQGKARGYVERQEVTGADGGAVIVKWDDENND
ncbi:MAG TPA: helix-turn-helix domain-containing protein [Anaerolineaceae bacterium]|nr:helix-turn-helix domain-containing protein [Anaerolineaceae bacterium]